MPHSHSPEPETMSMLREALPALLRDSLTVPSGAVAVGAMLRGSLGLQGAPAPQFVAYLPEGHIVDVEIYPEAARDAQSWAEALIGIAVDLDPRAAIGAAQARVGVYAPLSGEKSWVDLWFGESPAPWTMPSASLPQAS